MTEQKVDILPFDSNYEDDDLDIEEFHDVEEPPEFHGTVTSLDDLKENKYAYRQINLPQILTDEYKITVKMLKESEIIEKALLTYAFTLDSQLMLIIPNTDINELVAGCANWIPGAPGLANYMVLNYQKLSEQQLKALVKVYEQKYPQIEIFTLMEYEEYLHECYGAFVTNYIRHTLKFHNAICINMSHFYEHVLKDLSKHL